MWRANRERDYNELREELDGVRREIAGLKEQLLEKLSSSSYTPVNLTPIVGRIEQLELWKGHVHGLLTKMTPAGKETLAHGGRGIMSIYRNP